MANKFTWQMTDFVNNKTYNEQTHANALQGGLPNFSNDGLEYDETESTITSGRGINNGVPFSIGKVGEKQDITANFTGYLIVKSELKNGATSVTTIIESATKMDVAESNDTIKYFTIYKLTNGTIDKENGDTRHSSYVKEVEITNTDDSHFIISINGRPSNEFSASTLSDAYIKSDSDKYFKAQYNIKLITESGWSDDDYTSSDVVDTMIFDMVKKLDTLKRTDNNTIGFYTRTSNYPNLHNALVNLIGYTDPKYFLYVFIDGINSTTGAPKTMTIVPDIISYKSDTPVIFNYILNNASNSPIKRGDYIMSANVFYENILANTITTKGNMTIGSNLDVTGIVKIGSELDVTGLMNIGAKTNFTGSVETNSSFTANNVIYGKDGFLANSGLPYQLFDAVGTNVNVAQNFLNLKYSGEDKFRLKFMDGDTSSPRVAALGYSAGNQNQPNRGYSFTNTGAFHINGTDNFKQLAYQSTMLEQQLELVEIIEEQNTALSRDTSKITLLKVKLKAELLEVKINETLEIEMIKVSNEIQQKQKELISEEINKQTKLLSKEDIENGKKATLSEEKLNAINYEVEQYAKEVKAMYEVKQKQIIATLESEE